MAIIWWNLRIRMTKQAISLHIDHRKQCSESDSRRTIRLFRADIPMGTMR